MNRTRRVWFWVVTPNPPVVTVKGPANAAIDSFAKATSKLSDSLAGIAQANTEVVTSMQQVGGHIMSLAEAETHNAKDLLAKAEQARNETDQLTTQRLKEAQQFYQRALEESAKATAANEAKMAAVRKEADDKVNVAAAHVQDLLATERQQLTAEQREVHTENLRIAREAEGVKIQARKQVAEVDKRMGDLSVKCTDLERQRDNAVRVAGDERERLADARGDLKKVRVELDTMTRRAAEGEEKARALEARLSALERDLRAAVASQNEARGNANEADKRLGVVNNELAHARKAAASQQGVVASLEQQVKALSADLARARTEATAANARAEARADELDKTHDRHTAALAKRDAKVKAAETEAATTLASYSEYRSRIEGTVRGKANA